MTNGIMLAKAGKIISDKLQVMGVPSFEDAFKPYEIRRDLEHRVYPSGVIPPRDINEIVIEVTERFDEEPYFAYNPHTRNPCIRYMISKVIKHLGMERRKSYSTMFMKTIVRNINRTLKEWDVKYEIYSKMSATDSSKATMYYKKSDLDAIVPEVSRKTIARPKT